MILLDIFLEVPAHLQVGMEEKKTPLRVLLLLHQAICQALSAAAQKVTMASDGDKTAVVQCCLASSQPNATTSFRFYRSSSPDAAR